jgi:hypothetical protein
MFAAPAVQALERRRQRLLGRIGHRREVAGVGRLDRTPLGDPSRDDFDPCGDVADERPDGVTELRVPRRGGVGRDAARDLAEW